MLPVRAHLIHVKNKRLMTLKIFVSILEVSDFAKFVQSLWILAPVRQVVAAGWWHSCCCCSKLTHTVGLNLQMGPSFLHQRANNITPFAHDLVASISVLTTDQFPPNGRWTHRNTHTALTHTHTRTWSSRKSWKWPQLCTLNETLGNRSAPLGGRKATEHPPMADVPSFISPVDAKFRASAGWRCSTAEDAQMWDISPKQVTRTR